jgi:predicted porin
LKKYLSSVAAIAIAAGCAGAALADDTATINGITFYGVVDVGTTYETHGARPEGTGSVGTEYLVQSYGNKAMFTASQSGLSQSRWGIKGAESLGDGWTGIFKVEGGINPLGGQITDGIRSVVNNNGVPLAQRSTVADSSQAGELFGRAAYAGVTHDKFGTLTFGRQTTLENDAVGTYDPMGASYAFALIGFSGATAGAGNTQDARWDNSVKYLGAYGPARLGLMYQFGGTLGRNDTGLGVDVGFDYAGLSFDGVYTHKKDEVAAGVLSTAQMADASLLGFNPQNTFAATVDDSTAYGLNAKYTWEKLKFYAGFEYIKFADPSSPLPEGFLDIGNYIGFFGTPTTLALGNTAAYAAQNGPTSVFANNKITHTYWTGVKYAATPKLELTAAYYRLEQNSYASGANTGCTDTRAGNCSGQENVFSAVADYHFTKKFDVYAGAMFSQVINGLASGFLHNNNLDPTVGMRYSW